MATPQAGDPRSWIDTLWELIDSIDFTELELFRDGEELENDVKTAMAWISEALGVPEEPENPDDNPNVEGL